MPGKLEGIQERDTMERLTFEDGEQDDTLLKIQKLTGEFLSPVWMRQKMDEPADRAWIEEKGRELCKELDQAFSGWKSTVVRSYDGKDVFSYLPVVFRSMQELRLAYQRHTAWRLYGPCRAGSLHGNLDLGDDGRRCFWYDRAICREKAKKHRYSIVQTIRRRKGGWEF